MTRAALIDLGTNSVRLLIVGLEPDGAYTIELQEKRPVSLGESSFTHHRLTDSAIDRTVAALKAMVKTAQAFQVDEIKAVATSATRDAENRDHFLERVRENTGLRLKVISGLEEARLIYSGVAHNLNLRDAPGLLIDIGGGSVELIIGDRHGYYELDSLPLGAARLAERFNLGAADGRVGRQTYQGLRDYALNHCRRFAETARQYDLAYCYGSSGTIENLVRLYARRHNPQAGGRKYPPLPTAALPELAAWLGAMSSQERTKTDGLEARKADLILAGCATLEAILNSLGLKSISAIDYGLKHGLIADLVNGPAGGPGARENSVRKLGRRCRYDEGHAETVAGLAVTAYDAFRAQGLITPSAQDRELIRLAALLHDIGKFVSYQGHHSHSYYLIKNSALLGFDNDEIDCLAFLALSHRKKNKRAWPYIQYEDSGERDYLQWRQLGFILRLAEILDSRRQGAQITFDLSGDREKTVFLLRAKPGLNFDFEIEALNKNVMFFQHLFGRTLAVGLRP